jgi:hypothetical protein
MTDLRRKRRISLLEDLGVVHVKSKRQNPEHDEQVNLFNWIKYNEPRHPKLRGIFAVPNGGYRSKTTAVNMKREGQKAGVWDIFIPHPKFLDGELVYLGMWIEMKAGKNRLTNEQKNFKEILSECEAEYAWAVCYTWHDAAKRICDYLDIKVSPFESESNDTQ